MEQERTYTLVMHTGDKSQAEPVLDNFLRFLATNEPPRSPGGAKLGIRCLVCGFTSWNPTDVAEKYCGSCHRFHDDE
jgi:hypothetical protein